MTLSRRQLFACLLPASVLALSACGGGDDDYWDEFRPRPATPLDLQQGRFIFTGFRYGAVFDPSWSATPATLSFGAASASAAPATLPFVLSTADGASSGTATLEADVLTLQLALVAPAHPFEADQRLAYDLSADVDDGRIRLVNRETGEEQTSAP